MTTENQRFIIELEKAKIEMEHSGIIETRNAMLVALVTIPFAIITFAKQLDLITNNGQLFAVAMVAAFCAKVIYDKILEYNKKLQDTQAKIDRLIARISENHSYAN